MLVLVLLSLVTTCLAAVIVEPVAYDELNYPRMTTITITIITSMNH